MFVMFLRGRASQAPRLEPDIPDAVDRDGRTNVDSPRTEALFKCYCLKSRKFSTVLEVSPDTHAFFS